MTVPNSTPVVNLPALYNPQPYAGDIRPTALPEVTLADAYSALLADSRCENTRRVRITDIAVFARFLGQSPSGVCVQFLAGGRRHGNAIVAAFRADLILAGRAGGSINRLLSTLRRLVFLANRLDLVDWSVSVDSVPAKPYRDTRGPGLDGWRKLWAAAVAAGSSGVAIRNRCMVRLLHDCALRKVRKSPAWTWNISTWTPGAWRSVGKAAEPTGSG